MFWIHGNHITNGKPLKKIPLLIDASMAFGTGRHASTEGCLLALSKIHFKKKKIKVLDIGCGSSILSIAVKKQNPGSYVIAQDIDKTALNISKENIKKNNIGKYQIKIEKNSNFSTKVRKQKIQFDLILVNILPNIIKRLSSDIKHYLKDDGFVILSGFTRNHYKDIYNLFFIKNFVLHEVLYIDCWISLILKRRK